MAGFSLGGNLSLLYLGQKGNPVNPLIKKAIAFSVPCDLTSSAGELAKFKNRIYMKRFLKMLYEKIKLKKAKFPQSICDEGYNEINEIKVFKGFDDRYTAPLHGFVDAHDYWKRCSSKPHIPYIKIPTLIVNAQNDPFLIPECYPLREAADNPNVI